MPAALRTRAVGSAYSGAGSTVTVTTDTTPRAGDVAVAVVSATGTARATAYPTVSSGWTVRVTTPDNNGPATRVATRTLTAAGPVSVTGTCSADSGVHAAIVVLSGATEDVVATFDLTLAGRYSNAGPTLGSAVSAPSAPIGAGALALSFHASYYESGASPSWSSPPAGRATWNPTSVADNAIAGVATYPTTTADGTTGVRTATLASQRKWIAAAIVVPPVESPPADVVARRVLDGYSSGSSLVDNAGRTLGMQVDLAEKGWIASHWFYRPDTTFSKPARSATFPDGSPVEIAGTALDWPDVGTQTGWLELPLTTPIPVPAGRYREATWTPGPKMHGQSNYWSTGVGGNGRGASPLAAPGSAAATNNDQGCYLVGGPGYPNAGSTGRANYGVDLTVLAAPSALPTSWRADTDSSSAATVGTAIGFKGTQRQDSAGVYETNPAPIPVEKAPGGRPGRATRITMGNTYQRVEHLPDHRTFVAGDDYYFGYAFYLDEFFPIDFDDFQVIEQIHAAPNTGSPVVAFEVRDGQFRLTGGANRPGASSPGQYAYDRVLLPTIQRERWYAVVYRIKFSDRPGNGGGGLWVWVDGTELVTNYAVPCGTVYGLDISTQGGDSYRKQGRYKRPRE